jgi:hypothetical protein
MKMIIAGGRSYKFTQKDIYQLEYICRVWEVTEIVSGGALGADREGEVFALNHKLPIKRFSADWDKHGRAAGPLRNREMAEYADAVVLFPGNKGTESMYKEALHAAIRIFDWTGKKR